MTGRFGVLLYAFIADLVTCMNAKILGPFKLVKLDTSPLGGDMMTFKNYIDQV